MTPHPRLALAVLALLPLLSGCAATRIPVEQRGMVMLLGLDAAPRAGYTVTLSYVNPLGTAAVGQRSGPGQASPALVRTATAATPMQAIAAASAYSYQYTDLSHIAGVVISAELARHGLAPVLDAFDRTQALAGLMYVVIARGGTARALLLATRASLPEPGFVWLKTIQWSRLETPFEAERLPEFLDRMAMEGEEPTTAGVVLAPAELEAGSPAIDLNGLAIFRHDKLQGWFNQQQALGWALLTRHIYRQVVSVTGAEPFALLLKGCRAAIQLRPGTAPRFDVRLQVAARLLSVADSSADFTRGPNPFAPFESAADQTLTRAVEAALAEAQSLRADPFGFGTQLRIQDPALWSSMRSRWNTRWFPRAAFDVRVSTAIDLPGLTVLGPLSPLSPPGG